MSRRSRLWAGAPPLPAETVGEARRTRARLLVIESPSRRTRSRGAALPASVAKSRTPVRPSNRRRGIKVKSELQRSYMAAISATAPTRESVITLWARTDPLLLRAPRVARIHGLHDAQRRSSYLLATGYAAIHIDRPPDNVYGRSSATSPSSSTPARSRMPAPCDSPGAPAVAGVGRRRVNCRDRARWRSATRRSARRAPRSR